MASRAETSYYPLKAGAKWHLRDEADDGARVTVQVADVDRIDGETVLVRLIETSKGVVWRTELISCTADGIFRTLALGVRVSRSASLARDAVARTLTDVVADMERGGRFVLGATTRPAPRRNRTRETASHLGTDDNPPQRRRA